MIKPLYDRVLLEKKEAETQTKSGILLPDANKDKPNFAKVIAVGEGAISDTGERLPMAVKVNDTVIYKQYATTEVKMDDKEYLIVEMKDILAIVEEGA